MMATAVRSTSFALVLFCAFPIVAAGEQNRDGNPWHRSGHPQRVAWYAKRSLNQHYSAGYVGGGAAIGGEPRMQSEGTFGVDYSGLLIKKNVWLNWWHGRHVQGGRGSYETEGPRLLHHK